MRAEPTGIPWVAFGAKPRVPGIAGGAVHTFQAAGNLFAGQQAEIAADLTVTSLGTTPGSTLLGVVVGGKMNGFACIDNPGEVGMQVARSGQNVIVALYGVAYQGTSPADAVKKVIVPSPALADIASVLGPYRLVTGEPAVSTQAFPVADARRYGVVSGGPSIQVKPGFARQVFPEWWGADPSGVADSTAALQAAIDTAIGSNVVLGASVTVVLSGRYKITNSLRAFYWVAGAFSFCTFAIEGTRGYIGGRQVEIMPTFLDRPAMILQAARAVVIKGVAFTGALTLVNPTYLQCLHDNGGTGGTPWWNNNNAARDQRYSPYCAILVDPFNAGGVPPDGGIPGHNGVAGATNYYTQNIGSSVVTIENCTARQFIIGFAFGTSNGSLQCDSITVRDCVTENVKISTAWGHSQHRNCNVIGLHALFVRQCFDSRNYGVGNGEMPNVVNGLVGGCCKWFMVAGASFGPGTIKGFYGESVWSAGQWAGNFPCTFDDCYFSLIPPGQGGNASSHLDCGGGPMIMRGGFFGYFNNVGGNVSYNTGAIFFDGIQLSGIPLVPRLANARFASTSDRWLIGGAGYGFSHEFRELFVSFASNVDPILGSTACVHENLNGSTTDYRRLRWREYEVNLTLDNAAVITVVHNADGSTTASFTSASAAPKLQVGDPVSVAIPTANWVRERFRSDDPDVQMGGTSFGTVQSIVGNLVTLQDVSNGFGSGIYFITLHRLPKFRYRTVGISTLGSAVVGSVFPTPSMWKVGDRISSANLATGTFITAIDTVAKTITLSQNAIATGTCELYDVRMVVEDCWMIAQPAYDVWFQDDFIRKINISVDANNEIQVGWRCTASGRGDGVAPAAVFKPVYEKITSP